MTPIRLDGPDHRASTRRLVNAGPGHRLHAPAPPGMGLCPTRSVGRFYFADADGPRRLATGRSSSGGWPTCRFAWYRRRWLALANATSRPLLYGIKHLLRGDGRAVWAASVPKVSSATASNSPPGWPLTTRRPPDGSGPRGEVLAADRWATDPGPRRSCPGPDHDRLPRGLRLHHPETGRRAWSRRRSRSGSGPEGLLDCHSSFVPAGVYGRQGLRGSGMAGQLDREAVLDGRAARAPSAFRLDDRG